MKLGFDFIGLAGFIALHLLCLDTFIMPIITHWSASIIPRWVNRSTASDCLYFPTFITLRCCVLGLVSFIISSWVYCSAFITFIPKPYNPSAKSEFLNYAAIKPIIFRTASDFLLKLGLTETNIENICKKSLLGKINAKQNSRNT